MGATEGDGGLLDQVKGLAEPVDYFHGLDWEGLCLPRNILSFSRRHPSHEVAGWSGISAESGRYDQHARFVLLLVLDGPGGVGVETEVWRLAPGDGILMFPHQVHYYMELPKSFCWLFVTFEMPREGWAGLGALRDQPRQVSGACRAELRHFLAAYERDHSPEGILQTSVALGRVLMSFAQGRPLEARGTDGGMLAKVREFVFSHLDGKLSVDTIATEVGCSGSYLRERFREDAGISLGHFVRSVRLVRATHLLQDGKQGVGDIARDCGFGSFTTFSRAFSQVYGMSPSEYRKLSLRSPLPKVPVKG